MAKHNPEYWEQRIANNTWQIYNSAEQKNAKLLNMYRKASMDIEDAITHLAIQQKAADGVLKNTDVHQQNHLVKLQREYLQILKQLGEDVESFAKQEMLTAYQENYSSVMESLGGVDFSMPNKKLFGKIADEPWRGSNFSKRLWKNQTQLGSVLNDVMTRGLAQGKTVTEMAINVSNAMQSGFNEAHRLVRTETMHYLNDSSLRAYKDAGVKKVQFWAAEDERTCEHCGELHCKTYPAEKPPLLPLHPNCRCTYLPIIDDESLSNDEEYAIIKYISPDSYSLNDKLRHDLELTSDEKRWIMNLDKALDKLPKYNGNLTRSLYFHNDENLTEYLEKYKPGNIIVENSYISTTKGEIYNPEGQVQIIIPNASKGKDISIFNAKEQEVLYKKDNEFTVLDNVEINGIHYIILGEV